SGCKGPAQPGNANNPHVPIIPTFRPDPGQSKHAIQRSAPEGADGFGKQNVDSPIHRKIAVESPILASVDRTCAQAAATSVPAPARSRASAGPPTIVQRSGRRPQ